MEMDGLIDAVEFQTYVLFNKSMCLDRRLCHIHNASLSAVHARVPLPRFVSQYSVLIHGCRAADHIVNHSRVTRDLSSHNHC